MFLLTASLLNKHLFTMLTRLGFSRAAATLSLSFNCLFTAASVECVPGVTRMSTCRQFTHLKYILALALFDTFWRIESLTLPWNAVAGPLAVLLLCRGQWELPWYNAAQWEWTVPYKHECNEHAIRILKGTKDVTLQMGRLGYSKHCLSCLHHSERSLSLFCLLAKLTSKTYVICWH